MVMRDRNHPAIITWGVRINESADSHDFYTQTNAAARQLDPTRPTSGVRNRRTSEFLEDLYTFNDFSGNAQDPTQLPWLITKSVGHTNPLKAEWSESDQISTMKTHLNVQNQAAQKSNIAGALGWVAFDYNTTFNGTTSPGGSKPSCVDYVCYHGGHGYLAPAEVPRLGVCLAARPSALRPVYRDR